MYDISEPQVMGILNVTPDSFYDGGRNTSVNDMLKNCEKMLSQILEQYERQGSFIDEESSKSEDLIKSRLQQ